MSGVGILCFAASYFVALCLESARFFFRSPIRTGLTIFWILAGLVAHTAYLYYHHIETVAAIDGVRSYFLVSAWGLAIVCLYLSLFHQKIPFGLALLPIVLLLIGGGTMVPETGNADAREIATLWRRLHSGSFFLATLGICIGFVAGVTYLLQDARLRQKRPSWTVLKLPTLEWSLAVCRQAMGASILLLGICIFSGLLLKPIRGGFAYWNDPLVIGTSLMFVFLLLFSGTSTFRLWKKEGRSVAVLTLLGFLFLVSILLFGLFFQNAHWKTKSKMTPAPSVSAGRSALPVCVREGMGLKYQKYYLAFPSPPFKGERVRVRGFEFRKTLNLFTECKSRFFKFKILTWAYPPHPNPLPPKGGRGECQNSVLALPFSGLHVTRKTPRKEAPR